MKRVVWVVFLFFLFVIGVILVISSNFSKTDRDIIKYDGRIYSNITHLDWFNDEEKARYQKGERIGVIRRNSNSSFMLLNYWATKLPKETVLFNTEEIEEGTPLIILAETPDGKFLFYRWLPKE